MYLLNNNVPGSVGDVGVHLHSSSQITPLCYFTTVLEAVFGQNLQSVVIVLHVLCPSPQPWEETIKKTQSDRNEGVFLVFGVKMQGLISENA